MTECDDFRRCFQQLTEHEPFQWQTRLYTLFVDSSFPSSCDIPTGLGKTSIIAIWMLALARKSQEGDIQNFPRRLVYVVNRRTVVDQATQEVMKSISALSHEPALKVVADSLKSLCVLSSDSPIAVSTLRGQLADNAEWRLDPARPAVIIGTVDMIGSRLLFSGYGCGFKSKPLHAAFLGQDVLLVHDEAHLEPAFQNLLTAIEEEQKRCREYRRFRVTALTATSRSGGDDEEQFRLMENEKVGVVHDRITAKKKVAFHLVDSKSKSIVDRVTELANGFRESGQAVLIYLRSLKTVAQVEKNLKKLSVQLLTGTLRGLERDKLAKRNSVFARFMPTSEVTPQSGTVYLICTSAGEVGVNISADHLICDLTPFDSMAQRFGRVNRFGNGDAQIEIVYSSPNDSGGKKKSSSYDDACFRTISLLKKLPALPDVDGECRYDACPEALLLLPEEEKIAAFTPLPTILPTTDILLDKWAMTSIRKNLPGRPAIAPWLHGVAEWEPPETHVAWRDEVEIIDDELAETIDLEEILSDYSLKPHELLRDTTKRVSEQLEKIAQRLPFSTAWLLSPGGEILRLSMAQLVEKDGYKKPLIDLSNCTVLLSPSVGGLKNGMLVGSEEHDKTTPYDVADMWWDESGAERRVRTWDDDDAPFGMRLIRTLDLCPTADEDEEDTSSKHRCRHWYVRPRSGDVEGLINSTGQQLLKAHLQSAEGYAEELVSKMGIRGNEARAVVFAAKCHDLGKNRKIWQRSVGNFEYPGIVLAKSVGRMSATRLSNYRHELGSLVDLFKDEEFAALGEEVKDMVLHFIATHHGRARPIFSADEIFDPQNTDDTVRSIAEDIPMRFARLQKKYGRWGLAYLESLVRVADIMASQITDTGKEEMP